MSSAHRVGRDWHSWCKRCGTKVVRVRESKWLALDGPPMQRGLLGAGVKEGGDVAGIGRADLEVGHRSSGRNMLGIADPALHILRLVGEMAADDYPQRNTVEWRLLRPVRVFILARNYRLFIDDAERLQVGITGTGTLAVQGQGELTVGATGEPQAYDGYVAVDVAPPPRPRRAG